MTYNQKVKLEKSQNWEGFMDNYYKQKSSSHGLTIIHETGILGFKDSYYPHKSSNHKLTVIHERAIFINLIIIHERVALTNCSYNLQMLRSSMKERLL